MNFHAEGDSLKTVVAIKQHRRHWARLGAWGLCIVALGIASREFFVDSGLYKKWIPEIHVDLNLSSLLVLAGIYMILLSIPFLPGVELGIILMCIVGSKMVMIVYLFTVFGLSLSFAMGRWLPEQTINLVLKKLKLSSFKDRSTSSGDLINRQAEKLLGPKFMFYLDKNPYWVTGILLNLPGNFILGGGGGIAMLSGLNRRMSFKCFVLTIAIATLPLPLLVLLGYIQLEGFL